MRSILIALLFLVPACAGLLAGKQFDQGMTLYNQGNYAQAAEYFRKATEENPEYAPAYLYLGRAYLNMGRYADALPPLRTAYRLDPAAFRGQATDLFLDALLGVAAGEFKRGNISGALDALREGLSFGPEGQAKVLPQMFSWGRESLSSGRLGDAVTLFREYVSAQPDLLGKAQGYLGLAQTFMANGDFLKALDAATSAARINPGLGSPQQLLGR